MSNEEFRFPIGAFKAQSHYNEVDLASYIGSIEQLPPQLSNTVSILSDDQLDCPYRKGGWTVRQVVHHLADSHINSYIRYRWALTEETPTIKPYNEKRWAQLPDAIEGPIELSLKLLDALHARWVLLLKQMSQEDYLKELSHPQWKTPLSLTVMTHLYAWHGEHHLSQISNLISRKGW